MAGWVAFLQLYCKRKIPEEFRKAFRKDLSSLWSRKVMEGLRKDSPDGFSTRSMFFVFVLLFYNCFMVLLLLNNYYYLIIIIVEVPPALAAQNVAFPYGASTSFSKSGHFIPWNEGYQNDPFVVGPPLRPATRPDSPPGRGAQMSQNLFQPNHHEVFGGAPKQCLLLLAPPAPRSYSMKLFFGGLS